MRGVAGLNRSAPQRRVCTRGHAVRPRRGGCGGGVSKGDGTDAATLTSLVPEHENFLRRFDVCIVRKERRASLRRYLCGQLSDLERKSIEPMAVSSGSHAA